MLSLSEAIVQFSAYLLTAGGRARSTVDSYRRDLEQFADITGVEQLAEINSSHVQTWLAELRKSELSASSLARKLSALRSFVSWATDFGHLAKNPIPKETTAPKALYLPHAMDQSEVQAILDAAQGQGFADLRDCALLETLYASGMRVSELCNLALVDLQLGEGFTMVTGKGNKQRLVPLGHYAVAALGRYLAESRGMLCRRAAMFGEVFLSTRGPLSRSTAFRIVKKYALLAGIKLKVSPHTFRHSCASHMLAGGADLRLVQELLGHASLTTTQIYTHIEKSRLRKAYDQTHPLA